jgi:hypothetical protein
MNQNRKSRKVEEDRRFWEAFRGCAEEKSVAPNRSKRVALWRWGRATVSALLFIIKVPQKGVFKAYFVIFGPEISVIASRFLPELIPFTAPNDIPAFGPQSQEYLHILNERLAPHADTTRPFFLPAFRTIS